MSSLMIFQFPTCMCVLFNCLFSNQPWGLTSAPLNASLSEKRASTRESSFIAAVIFHKQMCWRWLHFKFWGPKWNVLRKSKEPKMFKPNVKVTMITTSCSNAIQVEQGFTSATVWLAVWQWMMIAIVSSKPATLNWTSSFSWAQRIS